MKIDSNIVKNCKVSIAAGILIGLGVIINIITPIPIIGAFLFSFGLITIIELHLALYTGKIGFGFNKQLLIILINNFIGIGITIYLYTIANSTFIQLITDASVNKFNKGYIQILICGIFCGALIHFAVKAKQPYITAMVIILFILIGAEHCIADFPYLFFNLSINNIFKLILVIIGNSIGAIIIEQLAKEDL